MTRNSAKRKRKKYSNPPPLYSAFLECPVEMGGGREGGWITMPTSSPPSLPLSYLGLLHLCVCAPPSFPCLAWPWPGLACPGLPVKHWGDAQMRCPSTLFSPPLLSLSLLLLLLTYTRRRNRNKVWRVCSMSFRGNVLLGIRNQNIKNCKIL